MYGYIYMTTNLINGKKYIGQHKSFEFDENYKGSGHALKTAIRKYGKSNFEVKMIEECKDLNDLNDREAYWITYYNAVESNDFYNIKSHDYIDENGKIHSNSCYIWINNGTEEKIIKYADLYKKDYKGWYTGKFSIKDQSGKNKGRICVNNGIEDRTILPFELDDYLSKGYVKGRLPCRWITKNSVTKYVPESQVDGYLSEGWVIGRNLKESSVGVQKGKIFITNGKINTTINPKDFQKYKEQGYWKGFLHNSSKLKPIWVKKDNEYQEITVDELKSYIDRGYKKISEKHVPASILNNSN